MEKPEVERLEWLFWVDRDTIILDTCRSPLGFLPIPMQQINGSDTQRDPAENINLLATKDWNGLNNGVFLMRVNRWSVDLFSAILALRHYRPDADLPFTEQSAMELLLNEAPFNKNVIWVPQWWFNAYGRGKDKEDFKPLTTDPNSQQYHARRGDFLVHFAGTGYRDQAMAPWLDHAENATEQHNYMNYLVLESCSSASQSSVLSPVYNEALLAEAPAILHRWLSPLAYATFGLDDTVSPKMRFGSPSLAS
ncbi:galactosyl transferase GMA12/MNN10 family protein [Verticillium alfalfae VaMs.102]|uniref:Galactosyl transferase GMA12/MNN10 family protein n=1 Tax=Verticillium alfalfae (strain VaMs.102 / ATCC MYA-4576 / FGSC 10136) TaxID=526221 RepID=C9SX18_VERA1|nr:galactosyl transferase GMA12/MNN10 family protein [Verticillium alfalfae VaMs.102]EEY23559.1 galactosyl transferase GMA12/MNN10 family protein [Verticillium alfalfae VaMs.102]